MQNTFRGQAPSASLPTLVSVVSVVIAPCPDRGHVLAIEGHILAIEVEDSLAADFVLSCFDGEGEMVAQFSPEGLRLLKWSPAFAINLDIPARMTGPFVDPLGEGKRIADDGAVVSSEIPELTPETLSQMMAPEGAAPTVEVCVVGVGEQAYGMRKIHRSEWYFGALPPVDEYLALRVQRTQGEVLS